MEKENHISMWIRSRKQMLLRGASVIFLLVVSGSLGYFFIQYRQSKKLLQNPTEAAKEEGKAIIEEMKKNFVLPQKEEPTVATIVDVKKLAQQPFFTQAQNGDKVIIYSLARKVILYRPSIKKVIDVATTNSTPTSLSATVSPTASVAAQSPVRVAILNGTSVDGLAAKTAETLEDSIRNIKITEKATASDSTYTATVVSFSDKQFEKKAQEIARVLKGTVGKVPPKEQKYTADIVIVLGQ